MDLSYHENSKNPRCSDGRALELAYHNLDDTHDHFGAWRGTLQGVPTKRTPAWEQNKTLLDYTSSTRDTRSSLPLGALLFVALLVRRAHQSAEGHDLPEAAVVVRGHGLQRVNAQGCHSATLVSATPTHMHMLNHTPTTTHGRMPLSDLLLWLDRFIACVDMHHDMRVRC